jgi:hypothetical protein
MAALSREPAAAQLEQVAPLVDAAESLEEQAALALRVDSTGLPWLGVASAGARGASLEAPLACAK